MKTTLFVKAASVVALLLLSSTANAKSWRIHNDTKYHPHFTDINAAMKSAEVQAGDTLYLDPGCTLLSAQTITKAVTIIGNGYFLQNGMVSATISAQTVINANNAKLMGVSFGSTVSIGADNITLERCRVYGRIINNRTCNGLNVLQCYIVTSDRYGALCGSSSYPFRNATIKNNIIRHLYNGWGSFGAIEYVHDSEISYNYLVVEGSASDNSREVLYNITNSQIYNNIIKRGRFPENVFSHHDASYNNTFHHNVVSATEGTFTNATDIVWLGTIDFSTVFAEGADDAAYRLKEGSPAKGAAADGGDCGPYGGATPYVEGGKPLYHPFINDITVSAKPVNGKIKLNLNAKMQNE